MWYCYALISDCGRYTYIGKTNDLKRRLRQHNGELSGGARYTRKGRPWKHFVYVKGFPTNSLALCFEWRWKFRRGRGKKGVYNALQKVCNCERWTRKCPKAETVPISVHFMENDIDIKVPEWVSISFDE